MKFNGRNVLVFPNALLGKNVRIGDNTIIYDNVVIGDDSIIANDCVIGEPTNDYYHHDNYINEKTVIGKNALIRSHAIIYSGTEIGDGFSCGHRVTIREKAKIGNQVAIGTLSDIQGFCTIGDYSRLHSNVHVGQGTQLGKFVFVYPYVVFTNDPHPPSNLCLGSTIGNYTQIAVHSVILPGVKIGEECLVGANSVVTKNVEEKLLVAGSPAKTICSVYEINSKEKEGEKHYPWMKNFERGMPWEGIGFDKWKLTSGND